MDCWRASKLSALGSSYIEATVKLGVCGVVNRITLADTEIVGTEKNKS